MTNVPPKNFVLKHSFKKVRTTNDVGVSSDEEEHFGVPWKISYFNQDCHRRLYLMCLKPETRESWSISVEADIKDFKKDGTHTVLSRSATFNSGKKKLDLGGPSSDDVFLVDLTVKITYTSGLSNSILRKFDQTAKDMSDLILKVNNRTYFYVQKLFLSCQSTWFKQVLADKTANSIFELKDIDSDDFQKLLEVLYGDSAIDDSNVEGILRLAVYYSTPNPKKRCEDFLIHKSTKSIKKKIQMAIRYGLPDLKARCLNSLRNLADIQAVLPSSLSFMDRSLLESLLLKAVSFK
ncbi:unnamed protein product [Caenorhabditis nigoni]